MAETLCRTPETDSPNPWASIEPRLTTNPGFESYVPRPGRFRQLRDLVLVSVESTSHSFGPCVCQSYSCHGDSYDKQMKKQCIKFLPIYIKIRLCVLILIKSLACVFSSYRNEWLLASVSKYHGKCFSISQKLDPMQPEFFWWQISNVTMRVWSEINDTGGFQ